MSRTFCPALLVVFLLSPVAVVRADSQAAAPPLRPSFEGRSKGAPERRDAAERTMRGPHGSTTAARRPLDIVLGGPRVYRTPATLAFTVVTPFDAGNREAGVELRCNAQPVASATWTIEHGTNTAREFRWALEDEGCVYELVAVLVRARDYVYVYQMIPTRALPVPAITRVNGRPRRF